MVAPIHKADVIFSLFLMRCTEHDAVGFGVEGISKTAMLQVLQSPARMNPLQPCRSCDERSARKSVTQLSFDIAPAVQPTASWPNLPTNVSFVDVLGTTVPDTLKEGGIVRMRVRV